MPSRSTSAVPDEHTHLRSIERDLRQKKPIVVSGHVEPLSNVPFHKDGPLTRWIMASAALNPELEHYVAIHQFSEVPAGERHYCDVHVHDYDELNIFHTTSSLRVDLTLGTETIQIEAPATVFIPAGTPHAANVNAGTGLMVAILFDGVFQAVGGAE
jgi:hypothetical protein